MDIEAKVYIFGAYFFVYFLRSNTTCFWNVQRRLNLLKQIEETNKKILDAATNKKVHMHMLERTKVRLGTGVFQMRHNHQDCD